MFSMYISSNLEGSLFFVEQERGRGVMWLTIQTEIYSLGILLKDSVATPFCHACIKTYIICIYTPSVEKYKTF